MKAALPAIGIGIGALVAKRLALKLAIKAARNKETARRAKALAEWVGLRNKLQGAIAVTTALHNSLIQALRRGLRDVAAADRAKGIRQSPAYRTVQRKLQAQIRQRDREVAAQRRNLARARQKYERSEARLRARAKSEIDRLETRLRELSR